MMFNNFSSTSFFVAKAQTVTMLAVVLLLALHGCIAVPIPSSSAEFPQQSPLEALLNVRTLAARLHESATTSYDTYIQDEFNGNSGYCADQITWEELIKIRMTALEWRNLGDEERFQRVRRDLQVFGLYLEEVKLDELDKDGHTDTANKVDETIQQLSGLMTAIAVTNNVLGFTSPTDVTEIMSTTLRNPPSEYARAIRDCVVLRDFKALVYRVHRDFTLLSSKYRS